MLFISIPAVPTGQNLAERLWYIILHQLISCLAQKIPLRCWDQCRMARHGVKNNQQNSMLQLSWNAPRWSRRGAAYIRKGWRTAWFFWSLHLLRPCWGCRIAGLQLRFGMHPVLALHVLKLLQPWWKVDCIINVCCILISVAVLCYLQNLGVRISWWCTLELISESGRWYSF